MISSDFNFYGLIGLVLVKIIFIAIFIIYCCKKSKDISAGLEEKCGSKEGGIQDLPPSYSDLMDNKDPPIYIESILNEEINPELNKEWAFDLDSLSVKPEIVDVIQRSRTNSCISVPNDNNSQSRSSSQHLNGLRLTLHQEAVFFPRSII